MLGRILRSEGEWSRVFDHGKPLRPRGWKPWQRPTDKPTTWRCECGRRFIGERRLRAHQRPANHGFASSIRNHSGRFVP